MAYSLQRSVGLNSDGSFAPNLASDQQQVADLLLKTPLPFGGLETSSGPAIDIPTPFVDGYISSELLGAIQMFQTVQSAGLNVDLRVDPGGPTLLLMIQLATGPRFPLVPFATVVLDVGEWTVEEAPPAPVSGLPTINFRLLPSVEQLVFDDGSIRVTVSLGGLLGASWGQSFGLACTKNLTLDALDQSVKSGAARTMGPVKLEQACDELRAQTRLAANGLFGGVSISADALGSFKFSGSLGDRYQQYSVGFEFPDTVVATGQLTVSRSQQLPAIGGEVKFDGTLSCTIKVKFRTPPEGGEASALASLAVVMIAGVTLAPTAAWIGEATLLGIRAVMQAAEAAGVAAEHVILGPSPKLL